MEQYKTCLVTQDFSQVKDIYYNETYALVTKYTIVIYNLILSNICTHSLSSGMDHTLS